MKQIEYAYYIGDNFIDLGSIDYLSLKYSIKKILLSGILHLLDIKELLNKIKLYLLKLIKCLTNYY